MLLHFTDWGRASIWWPLMGGRGIRKPTYGFPQTLCLFPYNQIGTLITVINLSNKYNYMLSPVSDSNLSLHIRALKISDTWSTPASYFDVPSHCLCHQMQPSFHPHHSVETVQHYQTIYISCWESSTLVMSWVSVWAVPAGLPNHPYHVFVHMIKNTSQEVSSEKPDGLYQWEYQSHFLKDTWLQQTLADGFKL